MTRFALLFTLLLGFIGMRHAEAQPVCDPGFSFTYIDAQTVQFTDQSVVGSPAFPDSIVSYFWQFGDFAGSTASTPDPSHTYSHAPGASGAYGVCLTITTVAGCTSTVCDTLPFPWTPGGGGTSGSGFGSSCTSSYTRTVDTIAAGSAYSVTFADDAFNSSGSSVVGWDWDFGDGGSSTAANPTHTYPMPPAGVSDTFDVCLAVTFADGCLDYACQPLILTGVGPGGCTAQFDATPTGPSAFLFADASWTTAAGDSAVAWDWTIDGSTFTTEEVNYTYAPPFVPGTLTDTVCLEVTFASGCSSIVCDFITYSNTTSCVDSSLIDTAAICPALFNPVCGCDGVTYSNACEAEALGGVTSYTPGACGSTGGGGGGPATGCIDPSLIDSTVVCPTVIAPVCGCDSVTYRNACEAVNIYGVTSYSPGACNDEVWPGDCNFDGVANNHDVLSIGLSYGNTGPVRPSASTAWVGQAAPNWSTGISYAAVGAAWWVNDKHVDANGDGVVDSLDVSVVFLNYGSTHAKSGSKSGSGLPLAPRFAAPGPFQSGDLVPVDIELGTVDTQATSIHGVAYSIEYDTALVVDSSIAVDVSPNWFTAGVQQVSLVKTMPGRIDIAQTRTDNVHVGGFGPIAAVSYVIQDDLAGRKLDGQDMILRITDAMAVDADGRPVQIKTGNDTAVVDAPTGIDLVDLPALRVQPNPATDRVRIVSGGPSVGSVTAFDPLGRQLDAYWDGSSIDVSAWAPGLYVLRIQTDAGTTVRKVVKR